MSQPISRVLSRTIIHLQPVSPQVSSGLPESNASSKRGFLFGLAPSGVYTATSCCQLRGALLPHHFTLTYELLRSQLLGGLFSAALAVNSHSPGVTWHPALWSPDFPPLTTSEIEYRLPKKQTAIAQLTQAKTNGVETNWQLAKLVTCSFSLKHRCVE